MGAGESNKKTVHCQRVGPKLTFTRAKDWVLCSHAALGERTACITHYMYEHTAGFLCLHTNTKIHSQWDFAYGVHILTKD